MKTDLKMLDDFITDTAAKGHIQMGYYLELKEAIYRLEDAGN